MTAVSESRKYDVNSRERSERMLSQLMTAVSQLQTTVSQLQSSNSELQRDVAAIKAHMNATGKFRNYSVIE